MISVQITHRLGLRDSVRMLLAAALLIVLPSCKAKSAQKPDSRPTDKVGLFGGEDVLWAYQQRIEGEHELGILRFVYRTSDPDKATDFMRVPGAGTVAGEVHSAALSKDRLHVVYQDGTHRSYGRTGVRAERNLPKKCLPMALCGDRVSGVLYAVVPSSVATQLISQAPEPSYSPATQPAEHQNREDSSSGLAVTSRPHDPEATLSIVRFERRLWRFDRDCAEIPASSSSCWLAVDGGVAYLLSGSNEGELGLSCSKDAEAEWSASSPLDGYAPGDILSLEAPKGHPLVLIKASSSGEEGASAMTLVDRSWQRGMPYGGSGDVVASALVGDLVALGSLDGEGELLLGEWPVAGGPSNAAPARLERLLPRPPSWINTRLPWFAYAALVVVMVAVLLSRRGTMMIAAELPKGQELASFSRRGSAFILDLAIFLPVWTAVMWPAAIEMMKEQAVDLALQDVPLTRQMTPLFLSRWLIAATLFSVYGSIFEAWMGATPGKRILGCRVVNENGQPCHAGAAVVRNFIRIFEMFPLFDLMPALVLMIMTRNRQRLGDLIARTLVVWSIDQPAENRPEQPQ